jgi:mono/diheme cytochrome c family protein
MFDFIGVGVLVLLTALFGFLAFKSWTAKNAILKWGGGIVTSLLTLVCGLLLVLGLVGFAKLNAKHNNPVSDVQIAGTPEQLARGQNLAQTCVGCHSPNAQMPLTGRNFFEGGGPPIGTLYAPNLTPAGNLASWSDGEIIRAIREGIHKDGRSLLIMPSGTFKNMSDEDVQALVAYLRSQPAAGEASPTPQITVVGALFMNIAPFQTAQEPVGVVTAPPAGVSAEYGQYLVSFIGCTDCHAPDLAGITPEESQGGPAGPNITKVIPSWTEEEFVTFFRTGQLPNGNPVGPEMPWQEYDKALSDDELKAIYAYLHGLPPID